MWKIKLRGLLTTIDSLYWILVTSLVISIYLLVNLAFRNVSGNFFVTYVVQPLLWSALAGFILWLPRKKYVAKIRLRRFLNWLAFICAGFNILFLFAAGMIFGFGKSPYSFTLTGIIINVIFLGTGLVGMELSRAWLINYFSGKHSFIVITLIGIFYTLLCLPLAKITGLSSEIEITKFIGSFVLPTLSENILTSYLALLGGAVPALIYRGAMQAFQWFCPILPNLEWTTKALLGTFIPVFSLFLVQRLYLHEAKEFKKSRREKENPAGWIVSTVVSVLIVWFSAGLFSSYPSVILSGSMSPGIKKGDIVLVKKTSAGEVGMGDIIQFRHGRVPINHRIIAVKEDKTFQTKGDANNVADPEPVLPDQVIGKVFFVVPKVGWLTIGIKTLTGGITVASRE